MLVLKLFNTSLHLIPQRFRSIQVCGSVIECEVVVRDLGVYLDSELSMKHHVNKIASACFYHTRRLRQIRHHVSREVLKQLVTSLVLSRLDYCNAILASLRASTLMPLQRAQNAAARLVLGLDRRSSIACQPSRNGRDRPGIDPRCHVSRARLILSRKICKLTTGHGYMAVH